MKFAISIPLSTVFVLFLTLVINVIGLKYSLEKYVPIYIDSVQEIIESQLSISPEGLQEIFSVGSMDSETKTEYNEVLQELSQVSTSLESLSKNPELYVSHTQVENIWPNAFHIGISPKMMTELEKTTYQQGILSIFSNPFSFSSDTPEWQFIIKIIQNFLIVNTIWILIILIFYGIWIRRIFRPIHLIIDTLKDFWIQKNSHLRYKKNDEFRPLINTLNELSASLDQQESIRNQFLSDLSHEILTPMTAISCLLEAINDGVMEINANTISILQKEMSRLVDISSHIMKSENFLSDSHQNIICKKIFLKEIFDEIILPYQGKTQKNGQNIFYNIDEKKYIFANREYFIQILHNIFSNFCKYAWKNSSLTISCENKKNISILTFSDNGIWVKDKELALLTEKFYKSDTGRNQNNNDLSMGIGLSIVAKIMSLHSGVIEIQHSKPHGITIILKFPKND